VKTSGNLIKYDIESIRGHVFNTIINKVEDELCWNIYYKVIAASIVGSINEYLFYDLKYTIKIRLKV